MREKERRRPAQLYFSMRRQPCPNQRSFLAPDAGETIRSLSAWAESDLLHLARAVGYELIRRGRAVPVALPVGEAVAGAGCAIADLSGV